jgi:hypothetical protein
MKIAFKKKFFPTLLPRSFNHPSVHPLPPVSQPLGPYPSYILYKHILIHIWVCVKSLGEKWHKMFPQWTRIFRPSLALRDTVHSSGRTPIKSILYLNRICLLRFPTPIIKRQVPSQSSRAGCEIYANIARRDKRS